jgi:hypothetical protein
MRSALAGASALMVVALVLGADLKAARPAVRDLQRDAAVERAAVRHLTASLARAVRDLVGPQSHKSAIHAFVATDVGSAEVAGAVRAGFAPERASPLDLLRAALLDLPPPAIG